MNGFLEQLRLSLVLHFRNRMALFYGYLFPTIFLVAFWVLYRHERVPIARHLGELLTIGVLGGACFGLPTTMVSERERGVWRRYRLAPVATWSVVASTRRRPVRTSADAPDCCRSCSPWSSACRRPRTCSDSGWRSRAWPSRSWVLVS